MKKGGHYDASGLIEAQFGIQNMQNMGSALDTGQIKK